MKKFLPVFAVIDMKHCDITLKDGGTESIIIKVGEGTFSFTETRNQEYRMNRGLLNTVREGDEAPVEWSLDIEWDSIQGSPGSPVSGGIDIIRGIIYGGEGYVSSDTDDPCASYAFDILAEYRPPCDAGAQDISLPHCRIESCAYDMQAGTLQLSGKANVTQATITASGS